MEENDLTDCLDLINSVFYIQEKFAASNSELDPILNEIVSDIISAISSALLGHYRLATSGLRNVLELSCSALFYLDHKIEYKLYKDFDFKADKYVSTLINEYHFFKSTYIKTFYPNIVNIEKELDSCSSYLSRTYGKLCDVVHGRYLSLTKTNNLTFEYNQSHFSKFKTILEHTLGAFFLLYILRFNDFKNASILNTVKKTNVIKL
ncbi:MAG: hypothetical protein QHC79_22525 [Pseudosphingobacterium sp.]|nr:hypothetical protein [Pseudosphingobacterium sp.]